MKKTLFLLLFSLFCLPLFAQTTEVPRLLNFQSVLTDAAGVPLPDGLYDVNFSVVDAAGTELYQETQSLETTAGVVSAMVGAQEELDLSVLGPETPKFLNVQVAGQGPSRQMEIVTVPYSLYAQQSLAAAPGSIGSEAIQAGAITAGHLAEDALQGLLGDVENSLFYSQGNSVQTVLRDLDMAIHQRQINLDDTRGALQTSIDRERLERREAVEAVRGELAVSNANLQSRMDAVNVSVDNLGARIDDVQTSVAVNRSDTDSRLAEAESNIDTCLASPRVRAMGIVFHSNPGSPELVWGVNVARVSMDGGGSTGIHFQNPIEPPYVVTLQRSNLGGAGSGEPMLADGSLASESFRMFSNSVGSARTHFVVFK